MKSGECHDETTITPFHRVVRKVLFKGGCMWILESQPKFRYVTVRNETNTVVTINENVNDDCTLLPSMRLTESHLPY